MIDEAEDGEEEEKLPDDCRLGHVLPLLREPPSAHHVQRVHPAQPEGLSLAAAGGLPRVPASEVHEIRLRVQVCSPTTQRGSAERQGDRLLR